MTSGQILNLSIVALYILLIVGVGTYFAFRKKDADRFMVAHKAMPGWAVGLSMFGSYISSISFLANPGQTFKTNWMFAGFTLVTPVGLAIGSTAFLRFYRRSGHVSAYTHLEERFGPWARTYAVLTYLILQMARMGTILYLLAQAVLPMLGGEAGNLSLQRTLIIAIGLLITLYTLFGGIEAVVWTGVLQSIILIAGPIICVTTLLLGTPGGLGGVIRVAGQAGKFSFGPYAWDWSIPTLWLVLLNSLIEHLRNWGIDQSYIQRYIAARSDREAVRSIWIAGLLYMPVAAVFWFIGTALWAYYEAWPGRLPLGMAPDSVFPHFITHAIVPGLSGLVIASIFAASMDSNLNSMATLTLIDGYKRYVNAEPDDRQALRVLWASTLFWGVASMGWALFMTLKGATSTIQFSANLGGLLGGGVLGLFLLGLIAPRVSSRAAAVSVATGVLVILWMTLSRVRVGEWAVWPEAWAAWRSPWHEMSAATVGTVTVLALGAAWAWAARPPTPPAAR